MNREHRLFLVAVLAGLSVIGVVAVNAGPNVEDPVLVRVDMRRGAVCTGESHYLFSAKDVDLKSDLAPRGFVLALEMPCARLNAIDNILALPSDRGGKMSVRTVAAVLSVREDGRCVADLKRELAPVNADVLAAVGSRFVDQTIDPVACNRLSQSLTGAQITNAGGWPISVAALPLPMKP